MNIKYLDLNQEVFMKSLLVEGLGNSENMHNQLADLCIGLHEEGDSKMTISKLIDGKITAYMKILAYLKGMAK